jgi:hypothetical protein
VTLPAHDEEHPTPEPAPWRLAAGGAVVLALALALVVLSWGGERDSATSTSPASLSAPDDTSAAADGVAEGSVGGGMERSPTPGTDAALLGAAATALDAWAAFAGSGDLDVLEGSFHPRGPQLAQLREEATTLPVDADAPPYTYRLDDARVVVHGEQRAVVRGTVVAERDGASTGSFDWDLTLRPGPDGTWMLWRVDPRAGE